MQRSIELVTVIEEMKAGDTICIFKGTCTSASEKHHKIIDLIFASIDYVQFSSSLLYL